MLRRVPSNWLGIDAVKKILMLIIKMLETKRAIIRAVLIVFGTYFSFLDRTSRISSSVTLASLNSLHLG